MGSKENSVMSQVQKISTFLWFNDQAQAAAEHYTAIFEGSKIVDTMRMGDKVAGVTFELGGQTYTAFNGGPHYQLTAAVSIYVSVETQPELDRVWEALLAGGGKPTRCGWLEDRFGLSWQVIPTVLPKLLSDPDRQRAERATNAMLGMQKLDIAALKRAAAGE
jgi:predicted 3-demethylubiquinone-9 3-methyltransferase (glyoxalase superfamily)